MALVLVAEDEEDLRSLVVDILIDVGYDVTEAEHGGVALEKAKDERPDIILLDVMMPVMDGFEVLTQLRQDPVTQATPVIMLTAFPPAKGELRAWKLGATHYIRKPFDPEEVELSVRVALSEAETSTEHEVARGGPSADRQTSTLQEPETVIRSGNQLLDQRLGGGIPHGSLALIEGSSSAGKSVLCQHLAYGSLLDGLGVAYVTSENTVASLSSKMKSIGLNVSEHLRTGALQIFPLDPTAPDPHPELSMEYLAQGIERLPSQHELIIVDSITEVAIDSQDRATLRFFSRFKRLCSNGRTVILTVHCDILDEKLLIRLRALCDAHFSLTVNQSQLKLVHVLEVRKLHGAELNTDLVFNFEVVPELGIRVNMATTIKV